MSDKTYQLPSSSVLPITIAVVAGVLAIGLLVAHLTGHTRWARDIDERMYESKVGWLIPGGIAYRVARRWGRRAGPLPYLLGGIYGVWGYHIGRQRYHATRGLTDPVPPAGGAPPRWRSSAESVDQIVVVPQARREK